MEKALIVVIATIVVLVIVFIMYYNKFIKGRLNVEKSISNIDVVRKKRYDLIPNLIECVKKYMSYEQETLTKIVDMRNLASKMESRQEKEAIDYNLGEQFKNVFALAEQYPDLKSDSQFTKLQTELTNIESELVKEKNGYNESVRHYNESIKLFPNSLFAAILGFAPVMFIGIDEKEKENIKVKFD